VCGAQVLVVEDNAINQKVLTRLLAVHGFAHAVANNGAEGVAFYKEHVGSIRIVLMDCHMGSRQERISSDWGEQE
jgi:CheY-like chemotaxis protein